MSVDTTIWRWGPGDGAPYTERLSWRTAITSSVSGKESRVRRRIHPRRYVDYTAVLPGGTECREVDATLHRDGIGPYIMPYWWDAARVASVVAVGTTGVAVYGLDINEYRDWQIGEYCVLRKGNQWTSFQVLQITEGMVRGEPAPPPEFFSGRVTAYPASLAILPGGTRTVRLSAAVATVSVSAEYIDYRSPVAAPLPDQFEGLDLLSHRPDQRPYDLGYEYLTDRIDQEIGTVNITDDAGQPFITRAQDHYFLRDRAGLWAHRKWWHKIGGSHQPFWAPTWNADLQPYQGFIGGPYNNYLFALGDAEIETSTGPSIACDTLYIRMENGQKIPARPYGINRDRIEDLEIEFDPPIEIDAPDEAPVGFRQVSFLHPVRLASDDVVITWHTTHAAVWRANLRMIDDPM